MKNLFFNSFKNLKFKGENKNALSNLIKIRL